MMKVVFLLVVLISCVLAESVNKEFYLRPGGEGEEVSISLVSKK